MKAFSKSDELVAFILYKMADITTIFDNNRKSVVYTGGNINGIYRYLEMIGSPKTLTTSGKCYHHFGP